jgi:lipopolysaccharide export LptBFGC system permease protein LptF
MTGAAMFGIAVRSILWQHLRAIGFVMFVLLIVAFSIDLSQTMDELITKAAETKQSLIRIIVPYLGYRAADIVTRLLPMACLAGAFFAELLRRQRMEDVILSAAGASPALVLWALLLIAAGVGSFQATMEGWLRPLAVFNQVDMGVGTYASRYRHHETDARWFVTDARAMQARVIISDTPQLRDITLFDGIDQDALNAILTAKSATAGAQPGEWDLQGVQRWVPDARGNMQPTQLAHATITFPLSEAELQYLTVPAFNLPNDDLRELRSTATGLRKADADIASYRRITAFFLPGIFILLGASLAQTGYKGRWFAPFRLTALAVLGYICVVSVKIFWSLGIFGQVPPLWACITSLILAAGLTFALQARRF